MKILNKLFGLVFATIAVFGLGFLLLIAGTLISKADIIDVSELNVQFINFFPGGVDPLITQNGIANRTLGQNLELHLDTALLNYGYWNSRVHSATDTVLNTDGSTSGGQFRTIGLEFHLGLNVTKNFQFGYYHHSQHILDSTYAYGPFPREDGIEVKFILYRSHNTPDSIF